MKRCPTGYRRNRVTKKCDRNNKVIRRVSGDEEEDDDLFQDDKEAPSHEASPAAVSGKEEDSDDLQDTPGDKLQEGEATRREEEEPAATGNGSDSSFSRLLDDNGFFDRSPEPDKSKSPEKSKSHKPERSSSSSETKKANKVHFISRRTQKQRELLERNQAKKIDKFIRNKDIVKQKTKFLNSICSDSGVCIAFGGRNAKIIKHFFKDFIGFDYIDSIVPISNKSANGFLYSLKYLRESYMAHAILKSSRKADADNLMYEYGVGVEINKLFYHKYPIFVETYKCYSYNTDESWKVFETPSLVPFLTDRNLKLNKNIRIWTSYLTDEVVDQAEKKNAQKHLELLKTELEKTQTDLTRANEVASRVAAGELPSPSAEMLKDVLVPFKNIDYELSCKDSKIICLLVQNIDKAPTLNHVWRNTNDMKVSEVLNVLYQIYFTLSAISSTYTHYDLHSNNVLLYIPVKDKFIQYHYHTREGDVVSFKSSFIVKIIDYGRNFVKPFSEEAEKEVCDTDECAPDCGSKHGYYFKNDNFKKIFVETSKKNESHDLRLLNEFRISVSEELNRGHHHRTNDSHRWLYDRLFTKVNYASEFGTPEKLETGIITLSRGGASTVKINNVKDAKTHLQQLLLQRREENEQLYANQTKLGDLHVYCDGKNMEYTSVIN
jgi:hypothetical protein